MKAEYNKGILFIRFNKDIDHSISYKLNTFLVPKILEQRIKYLVFNFYDVNNIDDFGLDAILNVKCAIKTNKGKICLCEISDVLSKKIKKLNMKRVKNETNALNLIGEI